MTKAQIAVINKTKKSLKREEWYHGVCIDLIVCNALTDQLCRHSQYRAVKELYFDTWYYDANKFYNDKYYEGN